MGESFSPSTIPILPAVCLLNRASYKSLWQSYVLMYLFSSNEARFSIASYARKKIIFSKKFWNLNNKRGQFGTYWNLFFTSRYTMLNWPVVVKHMNILQFRRFHWNSLLKSSFSNFVVRITSGGRGKNTSFYLRTHCFCNLFVFWTHPVRRSLLSTQYI